MHMSRREFLITSSTALAGWSCEAGTEGLRSAKENALMIPLEQADAGVVDAYIAGELDAGLAAVTIGEQFLVHLNDSTCSHHHHGCYVKAGTYEVGVPVRYLGGSHEVTFLPEELEQLKNNQRIPFSTTGPGPGHGHCGMAWRKDAFPPDQSLEIQCDTVGTATCV
jgi:hypothetical protein